MASKNKKYYAVLKGRTTGIFTNWQDCEAQIKGFSGALYKSFKTQAEAEIALNFSEQEFIALSKSNKSQQPKILDTITNCNEIIMDSICVDASCRGNPGDVEYQGVDTATKKIIFHKKPMSYGTNNLGEFLGIVHGLAYLKSQGKNIPIYSDSTTAMLWVKNKKVRTKLKRTDNNQEIFDLVARAIKWLEENDYNNPILKWDTVSWGEIPADFGRK
ncbi:MAG TPA: viroplasmin family protein [Xenococcaceae cyanobacterium]